MAALQDAGSFPAGRGRAPIRNIAITLPLLSFGAGAADAFAFLALGGIFTANMTGNAVLAALFNRAGYAQVLTGALCAISVFALALWAGFRMTRTAAKAGRNETAMLKALALAAICHAIVAVIWWIRPHSLVEVLDMIMASAAAMALQTVAAKRDHVSRGSTTTYLTGTLADLMQDVAEARAGWMNTRWIPIIALPLGAASSTALLLISPWITPLLPLAVTLLCMMIIVGPSGRSCRGLSQAS